MNLSKAIEISSQSDKTNTGITLKEILDAEKLLIEAGKELVELRETTLWGEWNLLPGETEE